MCSYPTRNKKFQKITIKFKKSKNTIIASFQAKIGWERRRKIENKKSFRCVRTRLVIENPKKIAKKFKKLETPS